MENVDPRPPPPPPAQIKGGKIAASSLIWGDGGGGRVGVLFHFILSKIVEELGVD